MPDAVASPPLLIIVAEVACWLGGLVLLVRLLRGHLGPNHSALVPWRVSVEGFVMCILFIAVGAYLLPIIVSNLSNETLGPAAYDTDWWMVVQNTASQLGMMSGALIGMIITCLSMPAIAVTRDRDEPSSGPLTPHPILSGVITFAIILPLLCAISFIWKTLIDSLGYPSGEQEMVRLFRKADTPALLGLMIVVVAIIAPITEEMIFRAGLFRYLRTRIPRWLAYLIPSVVFAFLHVNWKTFSGLNTLLPLILLAVFFSYAYERTGRIVVPMIAHALFNLHTILLVMAGVTT